MTPQGSRGQGFGRWLRGAFTERLPYKAAALFFAIVLWVVVSGEERTEAVIPVRFAPMADSSLGAPVADPRLQALVEGRGREIIKLYASPPVVTPVLGPGLPLTITLDIALSDVKMPEDVDVSLRDVRPRRITVKFERPTRPAVADAPVIPADTSRDTVP